MLCAAGKMLVKSSPPYSERQQEYSQIYNAASHHYYFSLYSVPTLAIQPLPNMLLLPILRLLHLKYLAHLKLQLAKEAQ